MTATDIRGVTRASTLHVWGPLVALWLIWGSTYLGIAIMGRSLPPLTSNGLRFATAAAVLGLILLATRGPKVFAVTPAQLRSTAIMGTMLLGVGIGTVSLAEHYLPSGIAALLVSVMPLWIIVLRFHAGERPSALTLAGVAIGMTGLVLMLLPGGTHPVSGGDGEVVLWSLAIMCSSFCWAFFSWRSSGFDLPSNTLVTTTLEMAFAAVALTTVGLLRGERIDAGAVNPSSWLALSYLVVASIAGYTAYTWLLGHAPMSLVSTYAYVNPLVAVLLGSLIIGEPITMDVLLGLTVVVGGVMLVVTGERRR
ncbi:MAG: EamA family transporter [Actinomycetes bacterium]